MQQTLRTLNYKPKSYTQFRKFLTQCHGHKRFFKITSFFLAKFPIQKLVMPFEVSTFKNYQISVKEIPNFDRFKKIFKTLCSRSWK